MHVILVIQKQLRFRVSSSESGLDLLRPPPPKRPAPPSSITPMPLLFFSDGLATALKPVKQCNSLHLIMHISKPVKSNSVAVCYHRRRRVLSQKAPSIDTARVQ